MYFGTIQMSMHLCAIIILCALRCKYETLGAQDQTKYFCTKFGPDLKLYALQISQVSKQMQFVRWSRSRLTLTAKPLNFGRHSQARSRLAGSAEKGRRGHNILANWVININDATSDVM